ncbi:MAG TPA: acetolactate decarboxylase [Acidimicrobiia bacterium]|nr:acetolactate decarboxylase [Acidimicrobiia bacterium]
MPELRAAVDESIWKALQERSASSGAPLDHLVNRALAEFLGVGHHTMYQVSTAGALVEGVNQGAVSVGTLRQHGDFGLGTFDGLDGEMVLLDGSVYRVRSDGSVDEVEDDALTPFAVATRFETGRAVDISITDLATLSAALDELRNSSNVFFAVRIDGRFERMRTRVVCRAAAGVKLVQATAHQFENELGPTSGTIVGFWSPPYASGLEVAGYHFHFLTDDRQAGGHVLDCAGDQLRAQVQMEGSVHIALPDNRAFLTADLRRDPTADLAKAEH